MNSSATVSGSTFETAGQNGNIILDPDVSRVPYIDSNFTLFILSSTNDNSLVLAASTVFLGSQTGNRTLLAPTADDFLTLLKDNVETFGYNGSTPFWVLFIPSSSMFMKSLLFFPKCFSQLYIILGKCSSALGYKEFIYFDICSSGFWKPTADPEYQYFARNVVNFVSESVEGYNFNFPLNSITFITTYYRTRYTQYQSATDNLSVKPETTIYFEDGTINKCPIRIFPILLNVKVAPTAYTILSQYAPGVSFDIFTAPISTYRLLWNITAQVYIIAIFLGALSSR